MATSNPFYRDKFQSAGLDVSDVVDLDAFHHLIPVTTKEELIDDQRSHPPYGSRLGVDPSEIRMVGTTGGTSGSGREIHAYTAFDEAAYADNLAPGCYWAGLRPGDTVLNTFPVSLSTAGQLLHSTFKRQRLFELPVGLYGSDEKLHHGLTFQAKAVVGTPSYLRNLAYLAQSQGIDLRESSVSVLLTATEAFSVGWAERLEAEWGAKLFEWYGNSQRMCAWNCEFGAVYKHRHGVLHWLPHMVHMEVIDPDSGEHVRPGEEGELVGTFLETQASPVIRFATADKVRFLGWNCCECGRALPGIESGTIARYDDMMKVKGVSVWPSDVDAIVLVDDEIEDYRGRVFLDKRSREQIEVAVKFTSTVSATRRKELLGDMEKKVLQSLGLRFDLKEAESKMGAFSDDRSKARRWIDDRSLT